jgi:bifunctional DNA primase/polymerase-like protein
MKRPGPPFGGRPDAEGDPTSAEILALRLQLLDNDWNVVPSSPRDKECYVVGWSAIETSEFHLSKWEWSYPAHTNTAAVGNRNYFGVDIDVLSDPELAHRIQALAFEHLGITPFIRVGQWPKRLLVYRKRYDVLETSNHGHGARTSSSTIYSRSFKAANGSGDGIEILSNSKQFVINGFHCKAGRPYCWVGGASPLEDTPNVAPLVRQGQVDEFLDAVEEILPLTSATSGRAGNGGDATRHVNTDGLIDDGRESYLRDCIWQAALEIEENGEALTAQAVASRGWELFEERAWNGDGKYRHDKQAMEKARLLIRRLGDGRVTLGGVIVTATPTHSIRPSTGKRDVLRARFQNLISAAHSRHHIGGTHDCRAARLQ